MFVNSCKFAVLFIGDWTWLKKKNTTRFYSKYRIWPTFCDTIKSLYQGYKREIRDKETTVRSVNK